MPTARYTRVDGKKSFNYCSTVTVVIFVALCLVGVWMFTSSSSPSQNIDVPQENQKTEVKQEAVKENSESKTKQFEDSNGDLPEDATKEDNNGSGSQDDKNKNESTSLEDKQEEKTDEVSSGDNESVKESSENKTKQFEDSNGDLAEDATKGDNNGSGSQDDKNNNENTAEDKNNNENTSSEDKQEEKTDEVPSGENESDDTNKRHVESEDKKEDELEYKKEDGTEDTKKEGDGDDSSGKKESEEGSDESKPESDENEKVEETNDEKKEEGGVEEKVEENQDNESDDNSGKGDAKTNDQGSQSDLLNETSTQNGAFSTQADESKKEKEAQTSSESKQQIEFPWKLCNTTAGTDYIPCLDNWDAIHHLLDTMHYEHRERHCPSEAPTCLVPLPEGYRPSIEWPKSREKIWYYNVPHTKLAKIKGHQNWVKVTGEYLTFPGGGTQFKNGALHYIEVIENMLPAVAWGRRSRVVLDVGCGVASFGGFLFDKDVLTMSFAPKDEHEAQTQFALERGIPAISAVMGTERLPFPGMAYDVVHCARCRVPWHVEGGKLLLELNRVLRPGGFFIWSATPVYQTLDVDVEIWNAMSKLTEQMCWKLVKKENDTLNQVGIAIYQKPSTNECYDQRSENEPPLCEQSDDRNAAWSVPLQACMHRVPEAELERGSHWPEQWSARLEKPPYWLTSAQVGVYGKPAPEDFSVDYEHWKNVVNKSYLKGLGISWKNVRNVMDMQAVYGGFAAALRDLQVWVMNVVSVDSPDTLPVIYERGLFGVYHNWCESFNTYPRSYDLLHADHLFSKIKIKCSMTGLVVEVDRILRPEGKLIVRDSVEVINKLETMLKSMNWKIRMTYSNNGEGLLCAQKTTWRPQEVETLQYALQ